MLRNLIVNGQKASDATYKAHAALKRGMGVQKNYGEGVTKFPSLNSGVTAVDEGIFVVTRDNLASGVNAAYDNRPDVAYDDIKQNELVILVAYEKGEKFRTTEFDNSTAISKGDGVGINAAGKWVKFASGKKYVAEGTEVEGGKTYLVISVVD